MDDEGMMDHAILWYGVNKTPNVHVHIRENRQEKIRTNNSANNTRQENPKEDFFWNNDFTPESPLFRFSSLPLKNEVQIGKQRKEKLAFR